MNKIGIVTFSLALGVLSMESGWAIRDQNSGPHHVTITHPVHGTITVPVHKSDVGIRHPESNVGGCDFTHSCYQNKYSPAQISTK